MKFLNLSCCLSTARPYKYMNIHWIWCGQWFRYSITDNCDTFSYTFIMFFNSSATCRDRDVVSISSGLYKLQVTVGRPSWWNHTMHHITRSHTMKFLVLSRRFFTAWSYETTNLHFMLRCQWFACSIPDNCDAFDYTFMLFNCSAITCPYQHVVHDSGGL